MSVFVITSDCVDFNQMMRQKYVINNILEDIYVEVTTSVGREEKVV